MGVIERHRILLDSTALRAAARGGNADRLSVPGLIVGPQARRRQAIGRSPLVGGRGCDCDDDGRAAEKAEKDRHFSIIVTIPGWH